MRSGGHRVASVPRRFRLTRSGQTGSNETHRDPAHCGRRIAAAGCGGSKPAPPLVVGAVEDAAKWAPDPDRAMAAAHEAGLDAIVLSAVWTTDATVERDLPPLRRAVRARRAAARRADPRRLPAQRSTPRRATTAQPSRRTPSSLARRLPAVHDFIVGNEPNLNLFWLPQFGTDGERRGRRLVRGAARRDLRRAEGASRTSRVIGGGLAPRGGDDPSASRQTHSPTAFIRDLGAAYRASGRKRPLMDVFSIHVYGESPRIPPAFAHPHTTSIGIADYDKLVALLGAAFDGTAQPGSKLPIVYGEYGVETHVPPAQGGALHGRARSCRRLDADDAGARLPQAIELAACQPTVRMLCFFHVIDETRLDGLQSGVCYADGTPKPSLAAVRASATRALACRADERARPVRRVHVLPGRPGVAAPAGRGAGGGEGRVRRGGRRVRRAVRRPPRLLDDRRAARDRLLPLEDHASATRISASSARRSTRRRSPAGSRRRTRTSRRRRRRSTRRRAGRARSCRRDRRTSSSTRS